MYSWKLSKDTEHNVKNLSSLFFTDSFDHFPAPINTQPKPKWTHPTLDFSIFNKDQPKAATFNKPTPITFLRQLASNTEKEFTELNNTETNQGRESYYFYSFFKAYLNTAASNDQINNYHPHQIIEKITSKPISTEYLARVLTYFHILKNDKLPISLIREAYNKKFYLEAQQILHSKFNVKFILPKTKSIFSNLNTPIKPTSSTTKENNNLPDPPNDDDIIMSESNNDNNNQNIDQTTEQNTEQNLQSVHVTTLSHNHFQ